MLLLSTLLGRLAGLNQDTGGVYETADLAVILEIDHPCRLTEAIARLLREGVLERLRRGLYVDVLNGYRPEVAGQRWLAPGYLSTETALDRHGLCRTGIVAFTYVTTRLIPRREQATRSLQGRQLVYRHLAPHLFFGYRPEAGILLAEPEKAALDLLYYLYKGQGSALCAADIDFASLRASRYRSYLRAYRRQAGFEQYALGRLRSPE